MPLVAATAKVPFTLRAMVSTTYGTSVVLEKAEAAIAPTVMLSAGI